MGFLNDQDAQEVKRRLDAVPGKVKILFFTRALDCDYCGQEELLLKEVAGLSDNLEVEVYNLIGDKRIADKYGIGRVPAIVLLDERGEDSGVRFFGIPAGYEFISLLEDIEDIGRGSTLLSEEVLSELRVLDSKPIHLQVFVTPNCPYCPSAVRAAHKFAIATDNIRADMIEATEFPALSRRYQVTGVPKTVINDKTEFVGAQGEEALLMYIKQALLGE
ncbi:thioredoxin family protein [bacterium]|nr:thioredoxin family protein [bacterium]